MTIWKDAKRKGWRYQFQHNGKRYSSNLFQTKREAESAMAEEKKQIKSIPGEQIPQGMDFKTAASLYLDFSERKHVRQTFEYKRYVLSNFSKIYGSLPITDITPQQIYSYLNSRPSNYNFNFHRKELLAMFSYARRVLKVIIHNPCEETERMPYTPPRKVLPNESDILKLIAAANPYNERDLLMVILLTLARIDEILRLTWEDVNLTHSTITLWTRKRRSGDLEADVLPMSQDLKSILEKRWKNRKSNEYVFVNPSTGNRYIRRPKFMAGLCKRAGVTPFGFHALRHYMASFLADKQKVSKMTISKLLRHRSLGTTEIYLQSIGDGQREAMESLNGIFSEKSN